MTRRVPPLQLEVSIMEPENNSNVTSFPRNPESSTINRKLAVRWGGHDSLFALPEGWIGVPAAFLRLYARLKPYALTVGEAMFVLELMSYKWSDNAPFPSYKSLAARMGVTDKMVRRYAANLEGKGYLVRSARIGSTNIFDLNPLFAALAAALAQERLPQAA
jgi:DNA-binding MarR family transcriptional regulator